MEKLNEDKVFKALVVEEQEGKFIRTVKTKSISDLPQGDLLVRVYYSSLNYKDALSASGNKGVTKNYPHTPGIDAVGVVEASSSSEFKIGDEVIVTGNDLGMNTSGGYGQYIRVPSAWVVKLPVGLTMKESMILGTAGFTAAIMVKKLTNVISPADGEVVVTGATGGVGSVSVAILSALGYKVIAVSGKAEEQAFLTKLGAEKVVHRDELMKENSRPLLSAAFAGAIDTVGGLMLESVIKQVKPYGAVVCCGNVASPKLNLTIFPFILRGVSLIGVSAQNTPMPLRTKVWNTLSKEWKLASLFDIYTEIKLDELSAYIDTILKGGIKGRIVVDMEA
jgi:putative YhdH/YhfP family quinone oxidoreductase